LSLTPPRFPQKVLTLSREVDECKPLGVGPFGGVFPLVKKIYKDGGGLKAFYRGVGTNLVRTTPAAAITFTAYELINWQLIPLGLQLRGEDTSTIA